MTKAEKYRGDTNAIAYPILNILDCIVEIDRDNQGLLIGEPENEDLHADGHG